MVWESAGLQSPALFSVEPAGGNGVLCAEATGMLWPGSATGGGKGCHYDLLLCFCPLFIFPSPFHQWILNLVLPSVVMQTCGCCEVLPCLQSCGASTEQALFPCHAVHIWAYIKGFQVASVAYQWLYRPLELLIQIPYKLKGVKIYQACLSVPDRE